MSNASTQSSFLLVDGTALAYRAFFAIPRLTTRDGRPSNALLGFIRMMDLLRRTWQPGPLAVVFDGGSPPERLALLPEYKAQRPSMPEDLRRQLEPINEYLAGADIPNLRRDETEADDLIASLAAAAVRGGVPSVLIATSDKDLFQLVNEKVCIVPPAGAGEKVDAAAVEARMGVAPDRIVDWLALTGDSVDNIPGVPGVGAKTAARLIREFGSLETLLSRLDRVEPARIRQKLEENLPAIRRNVAMMTLRTDLAVPPLWVRPPPSPRPAALLPFFERWDLHSLARDLQNPTLL